MAVKHIVEYFNQVADQYQEMLDNIKDMEKDVSENLTAPELLDRIKQMAEPVKNNYMTLSYIMYLLNMPNRKEKEKRYTKMNKKLLSAIDSKNTKEGILEENKRTIESLNKDV